LYISFSGHTVKQIFYNNFYSASIMSCNESGFFMSLTWPVIAAKSQILCFEITNLLKRLKRNFKTKAAITSIKNLQINKMLRSAVQMGMEIDEMVKKSHLGTTVAQAQSETPEGLILSVIQGQTQGVVPANRPGRGVFGRGLPQRL
jgi:hypothetical protein